MSSKPYTVPAEVAARYPYVLPTVPPRGPHPEETVPVGKKSSITLVISSGSYHSPNSRREAKRAARRRSQ